MKHISPVVNARSFTCPLCGVLSLHTWFSATIELQNTVNANPKIIRTARCNHCLKFTVWRNDEMLYPNTGSSPFPNPDMPETVNKLYLEAASVSNMSPRGAAALLRLALQILCKELGEKGENINHDIKSLVSKGLPPLVQQSLDIVRVTGNDAVHPGQIDTDNVEVVNNLFNLINVIVEYMISLPKQINGIYEGLPLNSVAAINKRDGRIAEK